MLARLLTAASVLFVFATARELGPLPSLDPGYACQLYICEYDCAKCFAQTGTVPDEPSYRTRFNETRALQESRWRKFDKILQPRSIYVISATNKQEDCRFGMELADAALNPAGQNIHREFATPMDLGPQPNNSPNYRRNIFSDLLIQSQDRPGCYNEEVPDMPRAQWSLPDANLYISNAKVEQPSEKPSTTATRPYDIKTMDLIGLVRQDPFIAYTSMNGAMPTHKYSAMAS